MLITGGLMRLNFSLDRQEIKKNIESVVNFLNKNHLDAFYISSTDRFLNEYVPLENCHRYYVTGFTGSTANVLLTAKGKVHLFVDGRYHEQADKEVDPTLVTSEKCPMTVSITGAFLERMKELGIKSIAVEGERTSKSFEEELSKIALLHPFDEEELSAVISFHKPATPSIIQAVSLNITGQTVKEKLGKILLPEEAMLVTALDSLAWLSNARGFHLPHQSPFLGVGLALNNILHVFVDPGTTITEEVKKNSALYFHYVNVSQIKETMMELKRRSNIEKVYYNPTQLSGAQYRLLVDVFGEKILRERRNGITEMHALKNDAEVQHMKDNFLKASKVVFDSITWTKKNCVQERR